MTHSTLPLPFTEILKSVPGFFGFRLEEEPAYEVIDSSDRVEVRRYAPALLAEVTFDRPHDEAIDHGFDILAKYVFGENAARDRTTMIAPVRRSHGVEREMTTPVVQRETHAGWTVSFFLGNGMTIYEAPVPNDARVKLRLEPARTVATVRYSGNDDAEKRAHARGALLSWLAQSSRWVRQSHVVWAPYDAPFVIPFLKRNEAQVEVIPKSR
jgi:hypothetical protein